MNAIEKALSDALGHGKDLSSLAGKLRDKFKAGVADLQAVYDEAESFVDNAVAKAKVGLDSFKAEVAKVEDEVEEAEGADKSTIGQFLTSVDFATNAPEKPADPAPQPEATVTRPEPEAPASEAPASPAHAAVAAEVPEALPEHVAAAVEAHADAVAQDLPADAVHAIVVNATASAGAEPEVAIKLADAVTTMPAPTEPVSGTATI